MGGTRHLKRLAAAPCLKIKRKEFKWIVKPSPGPHPKNLCIPLAVLIRDYLGFARNMREVKYILNNRYVKVDGKVRRDPKFPVGLFDIVSFDKIEKAYRIVIDNHERLYPVEIPYGENIKVGKIINKKLVKGGKIQLTTNDGRNFLLDSTDLKPHDSIVYEVPSQKIIKGIKMKEGNLVYILFGAFAGKIGKILEIHPGSMSKPWIVKLDVDGKEVYTVRDKIIVIGENEPEIKWGDLVGQ
jgi:small subunit ribosomal protein S4e